MMPYQREKFMGDTSRKRWWSMRYYTAMAIIFSLLVVITMKIEMRFLDGMLTIRMAKMNVTSSAVLSDRPPLILPEPNRLCVQNQYAKSLSLSLEEYARLADDWIKHRAQHEKKVTHSTISQDHNWDRFQPFDPMGSCNHTSLGNKIGCGVDENQMEAPCVVYSIGGNNKWHFEMDVLKKTPCEVHTFDCTGKESRFQKPDDPRLSFHYVCLGTENKNVTKRKGVRQFWTLQKMQKNLGHDVIDLLKMDIEGYEFPVFESWPLLTDYRSSDTVLPMQVLVEVHYRTQMSELSHSSSYDWKFGTDMIHLQVRFLDMGYVVAIRDDSTKCGHCTELTLVRIRCPPTKPIIVES